MNTPAIIVTTYIGSTPDKLWNALTDPNVTERYWSGTRMVHDGFPENSAVYRACSVAWPMILSSLKTLLETGAPLPDFAEQPATP